MCKTVFQVLHIILLPTSFSLWPPSLWFIVLENNFEMNGRFCKQLLYSITVVVLVLDMFSVRGEPLSKCQKATQESLRWVGDAKIETGSRRLQPLCHYDEVKGIKKTKPILSRQLLKDIFLAIKDSCIPLSHHVRWNLAPKKNNMAVSIKHEISRTIYKPEGDMIIVCLIHLYAPLLHCSFFSWGIWGIWDKIYRWQQTLKHNLKIPTVTSTYCRPLGSRHKHKYALVHTRPPTNNRGQEKQPGFRDL